MKRWSKGGSLIRTSDSSSRGNRPVFAAGVTVVREPIIMEIVLTETESYRSLL